MSKYIVKYTNIHGAIRGYLGNHGYRGDTYVSNYGFYLADREEKAFRFSTQEAAMLGTNIYNSCDAFSVPIIKEVKE